MLRYAITDRTQSAADEPTRRHTLLTHAARLAASGIDYLQLREKDLPTAALASLARDLLQTLHTHSPNPASPTRLLINSRADIALATQADGVHLTAAPGQLTPSQIRQLYAAANLPTPTVSLSCHTLEDIARATLTDPRPDLILFGPIFEKRVGPTLVSPGLGLDLLRQACALATPAPVLALGGITSSNTEACLTAGAAGLAAIRLFQVASRE